MSLLTSVMLDRSGDCSDQCVSIANTIFYGQLSRPVLLTEMRRVAFEKTQKDIEACGT